LYKNGLLIKLSCIILPCLSAHYKYYFNRCIDYYFSNSETFTQSSLLKDLATKAFGGSTSKLVMRALDESTSKEEIADIRQLLNDLEK